MTFQCAFPTYKGDKAHRNSPMTFQCAFPTYKGDKAHRKGVVVR